MQTFSRCSSLSTLLAKNLVSSAWIKFLYMLLLQEFPLDQQPFRMLLLPVGILFCF